ncbi:MAG: hypothetical protein ABR524_06010, partial [Thermoanaerobaculia bacterium]
LQDDGLPMTGFCRAFSSGFWLSSSGFAFSSGFWLLASGLVLRLLASGFPSTFPAREMPIPPPGLGSFDE